MNADTFVKVAQSLMVFILLSWIFFQQFIAGAHNVRRREKKTCNGRKKGWSTNTGEVQ